MAVKLWTGNFMRVSIANLLLFISLYVLFPVLSLEMADRLDVSVAQTGTVFLFFIIGMFLIGPFHAYLVDAYKRKYVCMLSFATMLAATVGYTFATNLTELFLLSIVQGVAFGMATTAGITLAIDITNSTLRSAGNVHFSWLARIGMIIGIILGVWLYQTYGVKIMLSVSVAIGALGLLVLSGVYVPFRAPIVTSIYSFDRFLLLRGWVSAINLILITFVPGLLISLTHLFLNDPFQGILEVSIPFFVGVGVGFLCALSLSRFLSIKDKTGWLVIIGLILEIVSLTFLNLDSFILIPAVALGFGLGLVVPEFLKMFVNLSQHCQRGTANTTHLLACETGVALGIVTACHMDTDTMLLTGRVVAVVALLFFLLITYPNYRKMKVR